MGFAPSQRRRRRVGSSSTELTLTPVMNLFMCIIPLLLMVAVFQKVAILDLLLPTSEEAGMSTPPPPGTDFTLAVVLGPEEVSLRRDDKVLYRSTGGLDPAGISRALREVKDSAPDKRDLILMVDGTVRYDDIIQTMDAARALEGKELFPDISLADRVIRGGK